METGAHRHGLECKEIFSLLSEYLDSELAVPICKDIEAHISDCPPCVEFVRSLRRTVELCRGYQSGEAPRPLPASAREELLSAYRKMLAARQTQEPPCHPSS